MANDRTDFLRSLRAVRAFQEKPVSDDALQDILQVARWSGSASNRQAAELVVLRDPQTLKALSALEGYAAHLRGAAVGIVIVMPGKWAEGDAFDEGRLAERIMLATAAHGLGSSIGWFSGRGRADAQELLNVPAGRMVRTAISIGHPAAPPRRGRRKPLDDIVHWERYR